MYALTVAALAAATATAAALPQGAVNDPISRSGNFTVVTANCANSTLNGYSLVLSPYGSYDRLLLGKDSIAASTAYRVSDAASPTQGTLNVYLSGPETIYEVDVPVPQDGVAAPVIAYAGANGTKGWDITDKEQLVYIQTNAPSASFLACPVDPDDDVFYSLAVTTPGPAPGSPGPGGCQYVELYVAFEPEEASS